MMNINKKITLTILITFTVIAVLFQANSQFTQPDGKFNGERALQDVKYQLSLGPRKPGSTAHRLIIEWLRDSLEEDEWDTTIQETMLLGHSIQNVVAKRGVGTPWIILGAHYDSRIYADQDKDPANRILPVPGANDGASGVALLLELARVIPKETPFEIWLVFFDAEDNGDIDGWDWILGSRTFVAELDEYPDAMVLVDMIGDSNLNISMEKYSDKTLMLDIWRIAASLGYFEYFLPIKTYAIVDDHIPFIQAGIPSVDIIDFDYPYWHSVEDTLDKISPHSLQIVGNTLLAWLDTLRE